MLVRMARLDFMEVRLGVFTLKIVGVAGTPDIASKG